MNDEIMEKTASEYARFHYADAMSQELCENDFKVGYTKGYGQAKEDLELTWKDMQLIYQIIDIADKECRIKRPEWMYGSKPFFTEVLRRFKEKKK